MKTVEFVFNQTMSCCGQPKGKCTCGNANKLTPRGGGLPIPNAVTNSALDFRAPETDKPKSQTVTNAKPVGIGLPRWTG